jgi:porphobilinogen synthase
MLEETAVRPEQLVWPVFIKESLSTPEEVASMPGVFRYPLRDLLTECSDLHARGLKAVALFPCTPPDKKSADGAEALRADTWLHRAVRALKKELPSLLVFTDVALDPYTTHGHDGLLTADGGDVDNDATIRVLARMAVAQAEAGADFVAPSDMMDGRVAAIRQSLDAAGFPQTGILAYSAKFASAFYGPFRDAVGSSRPAGSYLDKKTYQLNPANRREALREALLDAAEAADILMVKPAGPYLDIIRDIRNSCDLPLAAYQVSGEYAQIAAASERGWIDRKQARNESLLAIRRAGADLVLTYFAHELVRERA